MDACASASATAATGRAQFSLVWLELIDTQDMASRAAATIKPPVGADAAPKIKELLAATQRVSALVESAHELLYMHIMPKGKDPAAPTPPIAEPAKAAKQTQEPGHACCCCCPVRSRDVHSPGKRSERGGERGYSTRAAARTSAAQRSRAGSESESESDDGGDGMDEDEDEDRGRRRHRAQRRRRTRHDRNDDDRSSIVYGNDERLHDALIANRIRIAHPFGDMASRVMQDRQAMATGRSARNEQRSPSAAAANSAAPRKRSSAGAERPRGAGSTSPGRGHHHSPISAAERSNGTKRKRSPVDRQASPGTRATSAPLDDGLRHMTRSQAANLTAEKVLDTRKLYSHTEFKIKWVEINRPAWIERRNCPAQASQMIEAFMKAQHKQKSKKQQKASTTPAGMSDHKSQSGSKSSKKAKQDSDDDEAEELFTVEKLIGVRTKYNKRQFLVRWDGYTSSEDTWEYAQDLRKYVPEIVKEYEEQLKGTRQRKPDAVSGQTQQKESPLGEDVETEDTRASARDRSEDGDAANTEQQRMLQIVPVGPRVREEDDDDDDMGEHSGSDSEESGEHGSHSAAGSSRQLALFRGGRYSKPLYSELQESDSDDDDGHDNDDRLEEDDHELDEELDDDDNDDDDDDDDDQESVDFSSSTGVKRKYALPAPSPSPTRLHTSTTVMESAKELLRRLRA